MNRFFILLCFALLTCSLKAQATFSPIYVKPQTSDVSLLQKSLAQREERRNKASEKYEDFLEFLGDTMDKLHQDDETIMWFQTLTQPYKNKLINDFENGDYGNVITNSITFKGDIKTNRELRARIKTNEQYQNARNIVQSRTSLTEKEKMEWLRSHPYKFCPLTDNVGNIIGAKDWMEIGGPDNTPVILP